MEPYEITRRRTDLGLSQADLARALAVDRATVCRWEAGTSRPRGAGLAGLEATFARLERNRANRVRRAKSARPDR